MIKYAVIPGMILSQRDGQWHWVRANELIRLYKVNPSECMVLIDQKDFMNDFSKLIILRPQYDGNYKLEGDNK